LDILSNERKIIIELKNRTNTDNDSSRKANLYKLAKFKEKYPDYRCIYVNINACNKNKTYNTKISTIIVCGQKIEHMVGITFLKFIFGKDTTIFVVII
jgi:hypothetical protein